MRWCGGPLKENFSQLYGIAHKKDVSVAALISFLGESYHWNLSFNQSILDWELELVIPFMDLLYSGVCGGTVDKLSWKLSSRDF